MTNEQKIAIKVRDALRTERKHLIGKNDAAANAITDFLLDASNESCVRLFKAIMEIKVES